MDSLTHGGLGPKSEGYWAQYSEGSVVFRLLWNIIPGFWLSWNLAVSPPPPRPRLRGVRLVIFVTEHPRAPHPWTAPQLQSPLQAKGEARHLPQRSRAPLAPKENLSLVTRDLQWKGQVWVRTWFPLGGGRGGHHLVTVPPGCPGDQRAFWGTVHGGGEGG